SFVLAIGFFASLGLPGLNSFWSEFMVFVGTYGSPNLDTMRRLIIIPLISIVVTAAYYVYTMQRILFGDVPEKLGQPHDLLPWDSLSLSSGSRPCCSSGSSGRTWCPCRRSLTAATCTMPSRSRRGSRFRH